jgi:hypothetical protein
MPATALPSGGESRPGRIPLAKGDWICVLGLVTVATAFIRWRMDFSRPPSEDAAMLLRYSENLAGGHGIVWNIGEAPVDGATDFLFMVLIALVRRLGVDLMLACHAVALTFHLATIPLVYWAVRSVARGPRVMALVGSVYIALGPGIRYVEAGFGTTVFAFFVALGATAWVALWRSPRPSALEFWFGLSCLAMGLARPEGAILAILLVVSLIPLIAPERRRPLAIGFGLTFGVPGAAYFVWHWLYFGYPLTNPIYVRSLDGNHLTSLRDAVKNAVLLLLPLGPVAILHLRKGYRHVAAVLTLPVAGFVAQWVVISHSMNFFMRYQYALVPLALVVWAPTAGRLAATLSTSQARIAALTAMAAALAIAIWIHTRPFEIGDLRGNAGRALAGFSHQYTMVTTEAGLLPLYSGWQAVDAWGLNDSWIAHHGLTDEYLERSHPALIVIASGNWPRWRQMTERLERFAKTGQYILAAEGFYVAPWALDSTAIVDAIHQADPEGMATLDRAMNKSAVAP